MTIKIEDIIKRGFIKENETEELMTKDRLVKVMLSDINGDLESIWCVRLLETDEGSVVVLANHSVAMMPARSWGLVLEAKPGDNGMLEAHMKDQEKRISKCYSAYVEHWKHMFEGEDGE